jgi:hypothetical protein
MVGRNEDRGRSRRLSVHDRGWSSTGRALSGQMIERLGDSVYGLHRAQGDDERMFLHLASKPRMTVSPSLASKPVDTVLVIWPQNHSLRFPGLGLRTGNCGLVIWSTKSWRRFLGLGLKTMWAMVCRLCHKTNGGIKTAWDMHQDLAEAWCRWCTWHHHRGHVEMKPKMDGSMRWHAWTLLPNFVVFIVLDHRGRLVIRFPINRTPRAGREVSNSSIALPPPSNRCFLRHVGVLHGVREERRESERSLKSSKEWEDVVAVSTPCRHFILSI